MVSIFVCSLLIFFTVHQFMSAIGRKCQVVNLDPANDRTAYPCALDVRDLVTLDEIMDENGLGPNGGVVYALEELEENIDWLQDELLKFDRKLLIFKKFHHHHDADY